MAAPAKFLFDMDFGAPDKTRERAATAAEIAQKIADAEARAYRAGYEAAQREAKDLPKLSNPARVPSLRSG